MSQLDTFIENDSNLSTTNQSASESIITPQPLCEPKLRAEMERLGMEKFSKVFCNVLSEEKEVLNPEELFRGEEFKKVYMKHLRAFHLAVYREFLPQANQYEREQFALIFSVMLERDLPKGKILDALSRTK